jgi:uncharacterized protein
VLDALSPVVTDSLVNLVSSLGGDKDKATQARFSYRDGLTRTEIDALYYRNWIGGKVVDIPADDSTREWRQWYAAKAAVAALEEEEKRLRLRQKVNLALKLAAKDGGAALLIGDGGAPDAEFDPALVGRRGLTFVHVVSRWDLSVEGIVLDPRSPWYGQASMYRMFLPDGTTIGIHPSRVIPFLGVPRPDRLVLMDPWGDSVYERLHDSIRDATAGSQTAASMLQEAKVDVVQVPGLTQGVQNAEYRQAVLQRFGLAMTLKALNNSLLLDKEESWEQKTLTFQGLPEIIEKLLTICAGAADMPVTRLLGRAPAGMNATGKADLEAYYTMVRSRQEGRLRPALEALDEALIRSALGRTPRGVYYEWRTLWSQPATDLAEISHKRAMAVRELAQAAIFKPEALQSAVIGQLEEDGFLPDIGEAVRTFPGVPAGPPGQTPAEAKEPAPPRGRRQAARRAEAEGEAEGEG